MGSVFGFFKKPKGTKEQLEDLENEIDKIEEYRILSVVRQKNYNALLALLSVITYIIGLIYLYFNYDRSKNYVFKTVSLCFLIFVPLIGYYAKNLVNIYFKWIKETNDIKRIALYKLKKKILSKVQETETFNDAKMILERFDPSALRNMSMSLSNLSSLDATFHTPLPTRSRVSPAAAQNTSRVISTHRPSPQSQKELPPGGNIIAFNAPQTFPNADNFPQRIDRTVKPILPQHRSIVEKMVDYMFADGPSNRYALICGRCHSHNGMALFDEFDYISYICAYCRFFNPARKMRPSAPKFDSMKAIGGPTIEEPNDEPVNSTKITEISSETCKPVVELPKGEAEEECAKADETLIEEAEEAPSKAEIASPLMETAPQNSDA